MYMRLAQMSECSGIFVLKAGNVRPTLSKLPYYDKKCVMILLLIPILWIQKCFSGHNAVFPYCSCWEGLQ